MYEVKRKVYPPTEIAHNDTMYRICNQSFHPKPKTQIENNEIDSRMVARLDILETTVSHLLDIMQRASKFIEQEKRIPSEKYEPNSKGAATHLILHANPEKPPLVVLLYSHLLSVTGCEFLFYSHVHSSISNMPLKLKQITESINRMHRNQRTNGISLRFIWTGSLPDCRMLSNTSAYPLYGEMSAVFNLLELSTHMDDRNEQREILQNIYLSLQFGVNAQMQDVLATLSKHRHFAHPQRVRPSIADCVLYLAILERKMKQHLPPELHDWMRFCANFESFILIEGCIGH